VARARMWLAQVTIAAVPQNNENRPINAHVSSFAQEPAGKVNGEYQFFLIILGHLPALCWTRNRTNTSKSPPGAGYWSVLERTMVASKARWRKLLPWA